MKKSSETAKLRKTPGGLRYNTGKPPYELLPPDAIEMLVKVYGHGTKKYAPHNWALGMSWTWCFGSMMRHAFKWLGGENCDQESGLPHMAHAAWNALALVAYAERKIGIDDRAKLKRWP